MNDLSLVLIDSLFQSHFLEYLPRVTALDTTLSLIPLAPR